MTLSTLLILGLNLIIFSTIICNVLAGPDDNLEIITEDVKLIKEDAQYYIDYNVANASDYHGIRWSLETSADWLSIDRLTGVLSGIPDNSHVGVYEVNVSVSEDSGLMDFHLFNLTVLNEEPYILTLNVMHGCSVKRTIPLVDGVF